MNLTPVEVAVFGPNPAFETIEAFRYRWGCAQELIRARWPQPKRRQRQPSPRPPDGLRTQAEAAAKLRCSIKTLTGYVKTGDLKYVVIGHGSKRPRKLFTDADLDQFIAHQTREAPTCPSDATRVPHSGSTIFKSEVVAFSARPRKPTSAKPKQ
jgi:hypothetical protein